jgi:hypothetical protein
MAKRHIQASSLIYFWPEIEALFSTAQRGDFWRMPKKLPSGGEIEKLDINYAQATSSQTPRSSEPSSKLVTRPKSMKKRSAGKQG